MPTLMTPQRLGSDPVTRLLTNNQRLPTTYKIKSETPTLLLQALQLGPGPTFPALWPTAPFRDSLVWPLTLANEGPHWFFSSVSHAVLPAPPACHPILASLNLVDPLRTVPCPGLLQLLYAELP